MQAGAVQHITQDDKKPTLDSKLCTLRYQVTYLKSQVGFKSDQIKISQKEASNSSPKIKTAKALLDYQFLRKINPL